MRWSAAEYDNSAVHIWRIITMHIASIGIDLGKTTFHLVALGERNKVLVRKKFSRNAKMSSALIGLEACADSHYVGARLRGQGHEVRLIPAQFVKPYRKSNKNDFKDAEASKISNL
ncbi:MAG TPA: hypothetical protein VL156_04000, partial [Terriglobales bacterium]|jgi:transposase|nr:hypothetical protein [Terriglobales bacterium]